MSDGPNDGGGENESKHNKKRKGGGGGGSGNGFKALGLSDEVYQGIVRMGFRMPTPVQRKSLPVVLTGVDTVVMARTGSGKTCAFLIPLMEKLLATPKGLHGNHVRGIILSPTRELSQQTLRVFYKLLSDTDIKAIGIHGAESMEKQFNLLASKPDVIVATPGRLAHHLSEIPDFHLGGCQICILDEADRLLEMGFTYQIREIARTLPESCQKLLFSATLPKQLVEFTKSGFAVDPQVVRLDNEATVSDELRIAFITCRSLDKNAALLHIMQHINIDKKAHKDTRTGLTLIFAATRHHVEFIATLLQASGHDATLIYGALDQDARKRNLASFKSGKQPVLVVTDVAARGIDVPLIDHVIHYHFPPSPKLFVHRSGRAARAGRIGYCWALVEPDEMPYMMDLHLFLGRKPSTGETETDKEPAYTLEEMTPDMVHYGSLPESIATVEVENVQRLLNSELTGSQEAESLRALTRVCNNAMKQYRKTRPEACRDAVRRAKTILEGERMQTGQRLGNGGIPPHPLLRSAELVHYHAIAKATKEKDKSNLGSLENMKKREEFLRALSNFRPKESVFEAFATGKTKETSIVSHIDKGRTTASGKKNDSTAALSAMKDMRRQMRMVRDKGSSLMVAGSISAREANGDIEDEHVMEHHSEDDEVEEEVADTPIETNKKVEENEFFHVSQPQHLKRRLSKAERRRLKKNPGSAVNQSSVNNDKPKKQMRGNDFRDPAFFIENDLSGNSEEAQRERYMDAAMQPSAANTVKGTTRTALRMEEAMLDIVGDENEELVKKQRMMRWDKAKRKYVQTTVGSELSGDSKSKKLRLESGQLVKGDKLKLGELYEKWQKKTKRSIGRTGVFDDADGEGDGPIAQEGPESKNDKNKKSNKKGEVKDVEPKTSTSIKKDRARKEKMRIKNMKKSDRRRYLAKLAEKKKSAPEQKKRSAPEMKKKSALARGSKRRR